MAKKSSKATTPSWRTLMRRAKDEDKAGKPKVSESLRKQAAILRKVGARKTSPKKTAPRSEATWEGIDTRSVLEAAAEYGGWQVGEMACPPGHGEIIGGAEHQFAEEIAKLARKKGGKDAIQNLITERIATARAEGHSLAHRDQTNAARQMHEAMSDAVVCGFLATAETYMMSNGGLPPSMIVSGHSMARIIDVLNRHGYFGKGRPNAT